jgi:4-hydroxy-4-methyl-2-oxoglutarate aldolase
MTTSLAPGILEAIRQFDTCTIANAVEHFKIRLRNEGYTQPGLRPVTGRLSRAIGYAATARVRSSDPPATGGYYLERTDWWGAIEKMPGPRIAVIEDLDPRPGGGSALGEVHAAILKAFHCSGAITNGSVRDIPAVSQMDFPVFAGTTSLSHAYTHMVDYGHPAEIFGLKIHTGDLIYADCHGVISIPHTIAAELPEAAQKLRDQELRIIGVCRSPGFSREKLLEAIRSERS